MSGLAGLMARRLCHDFAGPAGAVGTTLEMLGDGPDNELVGLAAESSAALVAILELYRYVLTPSAEPVGGGRARQLVVAWLAARGGPKLDWADNEVAWPAGTAALTAGLAMVAAEAAPHGVTLVVRAGEVETPGVNLPADVTAALGGAPAETTRSALAAVLHEQATSAGILLVAEPGETLRLAAQPTQR